MLECFILEIIPFLFKIAKNATKLSYLLRNAVLLIIFGSWVENLKKKVLES